MWAQNSGKKSERKPTVLRTANGVVAALLCLLFAAHMLLGSVKFAYPAFDGKPVWVVRERWQKPAKK